VVGGSGVRVHNPQVAVDRVPVRTMVSWRVMVMALSVKSALQPWAQSWVMHNREVDMSVGSRTRDRMKQGHGRVKKIADPKIFNQSAGKSVSYAHAAHLGMEKHTKSRSLLHLTSKQ
jgi:hypothetical protein